MTHSAAKLTIVSARIQNLRNFTDSTLLLDRPRLVLVGPNNAGKTSVLKLIDWLLNHADKEQLIGERPVDDELMSLLVPARNTSKRARRLTLKVEVPDGRSHKKYCCDNGQATLRLNLKKPGDWKCYLALGPPKKGEASRRDQAALDLLDRLRDDILFSYIPTFRDGASKRFANILRSEFKSRLSEAATHRKRGGTKAEYRKAGRCVTQLKEIAESLTAPLWDEMKEHLPQGLASSSRTNLSIGQEDLVGWLAEHVQLTFSTGEHDEKTVSISQLGSGLQSLLDVAIHRSRLEETTRRSILVIEEPESFLHPAVQRSLASKLFNDSTIDQLIVTTHSPFVIEEASYEDVVICSGQRFFAPSAASDPKRAEINTAFLSGLGAEMLFAQSVLFVEGEGDRLFFEAIRRRMALLDESGQMDKLFVVHVGGKTCFRPWIQLVESYRGKRKGLEPIQWLVVADSDATREVDRALREASVPQSQSYRQALERISSARSNGNAPPLHDLRDFNATCEQESLNVHFLPQDLEDCILRDASAQSLRRIAETLGDDDPNAIDKQHLLRRLRNKKEPWRRASIGQFFPAKELCIDLRVALQRWITPVMGNDDATRFVESFVSM